MPSDRKRLLGYVEVIQLILGVTDKLQYIIMHVLSVTALGSYAYFGCTGVLREHMILTILLKCGSRGGGGVAGVRIPPGKSQVILVSIGNNKLDPPGKSWTPWKMSDPLRNLEK